MAKTAFLFPGQGAQIVGMGRDLYESDAASRAFFDRLCQLVDFDLKALCFEGPEETLAQTEYTQACLVAVELMLLKALEARGVTADVVAGLSLGEYTALAAAGVLEPEDAVVLVNARGKIMAEALPEGTSQMAAVLGMSDADLEAVCLQARTAGVVEIANYNCPGQRVIGGERLAVEKAVQLATENGARKVIGLNVSGAFHTSLLKEAGQKLRQELDQMSFKSPVRPIVFNKTGQYEEQDIEALMEAQISSPVQFEASIEWLLKAGVEVFVEVGPGKTLSGFVKKIHRKAEIHQVSDCESLEKTVLKLSEA